MNAHVLPASSDRYSPLFACRLAPGVGFALGSVSASTSAYTMFGDERAMSRPMRPFIVSGNPPPVISVHVSPPSVVFHSPDPLPPDWRKYGPRTRWYAAA